jgi:signal recognition particle subunit SRP14
VVEVGKAAEEFYRRYAEVCKRGMEGLRKRDRKKGRKKGKKAGGVGAGAGKGT